MKTSSQKRDQDSYAPRATMPPEQRGSGTEPVALPPFVLGSTDISEGETIGERYLYNGLECGGQNLSPDLRWSHMPAGTKSIAVTLYDPDARAGSGWWHWVMYDIPPGVSRLPTGAGDPSRAFMPGVVHGTTSFGKPGYGGPCPPKGDPPHRYVFSVHALDVDRLEVRAGDRVSDLDFMIQAHAIDSASLTAKYGR
ncbi:MAG TPA: YbhB/YbcL family Raf kinase inhibitor-like protein [Burkholderiales bacterium]|nr:YbhB/YbcL family Raf kinase inhibitor-like protein [Burkholderiales bacterium]